MKKNLFLGFIAFAAMAVTSCTNDDVNEFIPQGKAIEFSTYLGRDAQARGTEADATSLKTTGFGVYAYLHTGTADYSNANFLSNEKVSGDAWGYTTKYWPKETAVKINFLAYGPHNASPSVSDGVLSFQVADEPENHIDLVVAEAELNQTSTTNSGTVAFDFKHMLSRLGFDIAVAGAESVTVTSVTFESTMKTSCTVDMKKDGTSGNELATTATGDEASKTYELTISGDNKYMFIVPQTLASATVTINYTATYEGGVTAEGRASGSLESTIFVQGTAYNIKASVAAGAPIEFSATVTAWEGPSGDVTVNSPIISNHTLGHKGLNAPLWSPIKGKRPY